VKTIQRYVVIIDLLDQLTNQEKHYISSRGNDIVD